MGNKRVLKLPFLSQSNTTLHPTSTSWPWPACVNLQTLSFRANNTHKDDTFRTFNSAFLDSENTVSSSSRSFSTMSDDFGGDPVQVLDDETVIRGLMRSSDRLFFDPEQSSSLIMGVTERHEKGDSLKVEYKESEMLSLDSNNPYEDFRKSMEEMVEAHGLNKDWQGLEELLSCYLKINGKNNHGYIVGAFIDLLVSLSFIDSCSTSTSTTNATTTTTTTSSTSCLSSSNSNYSSPSSPLSLPSSSLTTPCLSSIVDHGDDDVDDDDDDDGNDGGDDDSGGKVPS